MFKKYLLLIAIMCSTVFLSDCGIYSFNGANLGTAKTIKIAFIENKAAIVEPELSQTFTEALRDKFLSETGLTIVTNNADIEVSGFINQYSTTFLALEGDEPAQTRLNMSAKLKYINNLDEDSNLERTFEAFSDFDASQELSAIQDQLNRDLINQILSDFFNETVNNW